MRSLAATRTSSSLTAVPAGPALCPQSHSVSTAVRAAVATGDGLLMHLRVVGDHDVQGVVVHPELLPKRHQCALVRLQRRTEQC